MDEILRALPATILVVTGAFISELAGALNVAVEGLMLLGSFLAVVTVQGPLGTIPGVIMAVLAGMMFGLMLGFVTVKWGANVFITGLGINLVSVSLTSILGVVFFQTKGVLRMEAHGTGPWIYGIEAISAVVVFAFLVVTFSWSLMGLRFRSLANHADMLHARGVNVDGYRIWALGLSGGLAALGGAFSTLSLGAYVPNGTSGKGWIALVLVYAGGKTPLGILLATMVYLGMDQAALRMQSSMENPGLLVGLPYLAVLLVLILVQTLTRKRFEL